METFLIQLCISCCLIFSPSVGNGFSLGIEGKMKSVVIETINTRHQVALKDIETFSSQRVNHYFENKTIFSYSIPNKQKWHGNQGFHSFLAIADDKQVIIDISYKELFEKYSIPIKSENDLANLMEIYCELSHAVIVNSKEELTEKFSPRGANSNEDTIRPPCISVSKSDEGKGDVTFFSVSGRADIVSMITISFDKDGKVAFKSDHISTKSPRK